jgi:hypothetical protein
MSTIRDSTNEISEVTFRTDKVRPPKAYSNSRRTGAEHTADESLSYQRIGYSTLKGWNTHEYP